MTERYRRRSERLIAFTSLVSALGAVGFAVAYVAGGQSQWTGLGLAVAFGGLAAALAAWARRFTQTGGAVEEHHGFRSSSQAQLELTERIQGGTTTWRRRFLAGLLGVSVGSIALALLLPVHSLLRRVGPGSSPDRRLRETPWRAGDLRLVDIDGRPVRATDVRAETIITVMPEGHPRDGDAPAFVVRLDPSRLKNPPSADDVSGIVAYSLVCTHAGCPVGQYDEATGHLLCPCHQSRFDLLDGARRVAGPASRGLPGLPITVDQEGYLRATGDFTEPPGPGYWGRP